MPPTLFVTFLIAGGLTLAAPLIPFLWNSRWLVGFVAGIAAGSFMAFLTRGFE